HNRTGFFPEQRRNQSADVPDVSEGPLEKWKQSDITLRVWRVRYFHHAFLLSRDCHLAANGRRLCGGKPAWRRRVRGRVAPRRDKASQTKCLRRLYRRGRMA